MKKILLIILVLVATVFLASAGWYYYNFKTYAPTTYVQEVPVEDGAMTDATSTKTETKNTKTGVTTPGAPTLTMAEIATHTSASSCYTVISGKVYDLTMWVNIHPGGKQAILSLCGVDGTERFLKKHGSDPSPNSSLARYYIANLAR